jgi:hypothetical protein
MQALQVLEVAGDPREMGRAQGRACRDVVRVALRDAGEARRGRLATSLLPFVTGPVLGSGMGREIVRHYPHLSERIQGIARGADQPIESLMALFVRAAGGCFEPGLAAAAPAAARGGETALLMRPLPDAPWLIRRSRPEVGFDSVELTLPWLATALAGVNESGLAALVAPCTGTSSGTPAPSALLLVQECLQRFHDVTGCIDWCRKRPASGRASIVLADSAGCVAAVEIDGADRSVVEASTGVLLSGGQRESHPALRKRMECDDPLSGDQGEFGACILVSPAERRLEVEVSGPSQSGAARFSVA